MTREEGLRHWVAQRMAALDQGEPSWPQRPRTVVLGFDGGGRSLRAASWAAHIADEVHVAVATSRRSGPATGPISRREALDWGNSVHAQVDEARSQLIERLSGLRMIDHQVDKSPTKAILHVAERVQAEMVLVGTSNRAWVARAALGSVSESLLHEAKTPTLLVNDEPVDGPIVAAIGTGKGSSLAAGWATQLAIWLDRELILATAPDDGQPPPGWEATRREARAVDVAWPARKGLLELVGEVDAALLVCGHGPAPGWIGSTAVGLARSAPCSVLIARSQGYQA